MPVRLVEWRGSLPDQDDPALVGQAEWCHCIPALHRVLANPAAVVEMPRYHDHMALHEGCAYWETAVYLLQSLLGWADPGKGLQWWYRNKQDDLGDPRLQLLKQVWNSEGQLDLLAVWYWVTGGPGYGFFWGKAGESEMPAIEERRGEDFLGDSWWRDFERRHAGQGFSPSDPYNGGGNTFHLGHSGISCSDLPGSLMHSRTDERKAVLLLDEARGWYPQLMKYGATLPPLEKSSWHVEVVVKPLGWLGTFRRSWVTGRWFQGRHMIHAAGNPEAR